MAWLMYEEIQTEMISDTPKDCILIVEDDVATQRVLKALLDRNDRLLSRLKAFSEIMLLALLILPTRQDGGR